MYTIKLSDEQIKNLNVFLGRVDLKGTVEAMALTEIVIAISRAEKENQGG